MTGILKNVANGNLTCKIEFGNAKQSRSKGWRLLIYENSKIYDTSINSSNPLKLQYTIKLVL